MAQENKDKKDKGKERSRAANTRPTSFRPGSIGRLHQDSLMQELMNRYPTTPLMNTAPMPTTAGAGIVPSATPNNASMMPPPKNEVQMPQAPLVVPPTGLNINVGGSSKIPTVTTSESFRAAPTKELPFQTFERLTGQKWGRSSTQNPEIRRMLEHFGISAPVGSAEANLALQKALLANAQNIQGE